MFCSGRPQVVCALTRFTPLSLKPTGATPLNSSLTLYCIYLHWRKDVVLARCNARGFSIIAPKSFKQVQHVSLGTTLMSKR